MTMKWYTIEVGGVRFAARAGITYEDIGGPESGPRLTCDLTVRELRELPSGRRIIIARDPRFFDNPHPMCPPTVFCNAVIEAIGCAVEAQ